MEIMEARKLFQQCCRDLVDSRFRGAKGRRQALLEFLALPADTDTVFMVYQACRRGLDNPAMVMSVRSDQLPSLCCRILTYRALGWPIPAIREKVGIKTVGEQLRNARNLLGAKNDALAVRVACSNSLLAQSLLKPENEWRNVDPPSTNVA